MSMRELFAKNKKAGKIDFIEVPLEWGRSNKEFVIYDFEGKYFCRIFYDNKYRQDNFIPKTDKIKEAIAQLKKDSSGTGIFNNDSEIRQKQELLDFIEKYEKRI